jgi:LRP1 type putative zinc finger protein
VSSEALFRCVCLGPVDEPGAEVAYQTSISIARHVFKGIMHDVGPDPSSSVAAGGGGFHHATDGSSPGMGEGSVAGARPVSSLAMVMDPYPTPTPGQYDSLHFFHGHPR